MKDPFFRIRIWVRWRVGWKSSILKSALEVLFSYFKILMTSKSVDSWRNCWLLLLTTDQIVQVWILKRQEHEISCIRCLKPKSQHTSEFLRRNYKTQDAVIADDWFLVANVSHEMNQILEINQNEMIWIAKQRIRVIGWCIYTVNTRISWCDPFGEKEFQFSIFPTYFFSMTPKSSLSHRQLLSLHSPFLAGYKS